MKNFFALSIVFTLINNSVVFGNLGTETHGGDVIACYDRSLFKPDGSVDKEAQITRLEIKDYWEGMKESTYHFQPPTLSEGDYWKNIETVLYNFLRIDFVLSSRLFERLNDLSSNSFKNSIGFVEQGELPEVDDTSSILNISAGSNCYDRQVAYQNANLGIGRKKIYISKTLFNLLSMTNKVGILMHELLLEDYLNFGKDFFRNDKGQILTDPIRLINFLMVSNFYEDQNRYYTYLKVQRDQKLFYFDEIYFNFQNHLFKINKSDFLNQYPEIKATYVKKYWHLDHTGFLDINFLASNDQGRTQFTMNPDSTLTINLTETNLKKATILGSFQIESTLFNGLVVQKLKILNSTYANLNFYGGRVINELQLFEKSDFYCESNDRNELEQFHIPTTLPSTKYILSTPEYIKGCTSISRSKTE